MSNTKEIQRRIKSVNNTKKITKAMEMVAASKMRKAVEAVLKTREYANLSWTTVINLARGVNGSRQHELLSKRAKIKKVAVVLIASNRGLCGGYNSAVINKAHESVVKHLTNEQGEKIETDFIVVGKRGLSVHSRYGYKIAAEFSKADVVYEVKETRPIAKLVIDDYLAKKYDKVVVAFTDFVNPARQVPRIKQLLPVDIRAEKDHYLGVVGKDTRVGIDPEFVQEKEDKYLRDKDSYVFTFEPGPEEVLNEMIPRLIEIQLFQALLESNASEHSARMAAMHMATDAAKDLVKELTLYYNKARQAGITAEIAEICAGANALAE